MVVSAEHWYTSGTWWAAIGVGVTLLIGIATLLVTWVPRQRLYYRAPPPTPLLPSGMRGIADLEIRHEGRLLNNPYLLEIMLTARGRRDIPSSAFDQGRPLVFGLGAGIVKVLQVRCNPTTALAPPVTHEGRTLKVGPELVGRRQTITIAVLVDGGRPSLTCIQPVLAQVTIVPRDPPTELSWAKVAVGLGGWAWVALLVLTSVPVPMVWGAAVAAGGATLVTIVEWWRSGGRGAVAFPG